MKKNKPLDHTLLRRTLPVSKLNFKTTAKLKPLTEFLGQERAVDAINFGIRINGYGYNLYAMGYAGSGKRSLISQVLGEYSKTCPTPSDWCYVYNFEAPERPLALELPAGYGIVLQQDMKAFVEELGPEILTIFESDEFHRGMKKIAANFAKKKKLLSKRRINEKKIPTLYKERHDKEKELQTSLTAIVINPLINKLKKKHAKFPDILTYLEAVRNDIIQHANDFIKQDEKTDVLTLSLETPMLTKYKINLLVDNSQLKGAPIIFEETPTYSNLISRVEHTSQAGVLTTNFTLIKPGSLHKANGGYLVVEMRKLRKHRDAWEALKNALYSQKIKIEPVHDEGDSVKPISLDPIPIPLKVKVIVIGERSIYYNLCQYDSDFTELFKVSVDFDDEIDRNDKNIQLYARLIGTIAKHENVRPLHASAVAAIIDQSTRFAEDIDKLSTHVRAIKNLIIESEYWASLKKKKVIDADDVKRAIDEQIYRMDRSRELYYQDITRDYIIIKTEGTAIGQTNCLSVRRVGNFSYGHPTRVTARVGVGKGKIVDIQREIKMAGPLHSKAGLIIGNLLSSRFGKDRPFSMSASIAFEQIYCWTDGDSASVGELCALLSALAEIPLSQALAITGSIDQYGEVQAVGGINEKIEGFFDVCKAKGMNGKQGVIIPAVNQKNLMLREDIVAAAKNNKFAIYPINTLDEALALLLVNTTPQKLYEKVEERLKKFAISRKQSNKAR